MKNFSLIAFAFFLPFQLKKMKSFVRFFTVHACAGLAALGHAATAADSRAYGNSVAAQRDGKIVVAGCAAVGRGAAQVALVRYNADGTLDTSFNETGKAAADFGADGYGRSVAMHGDGRIVVTGYTTKSYESKKECALACFKANGSLDTSFNGTGKVTTNFGGDGNAE